MKKYITEFIATFGLIFLGTGASITNEITKGTVSHTGVAIAWGMVVMAMIYTFGDKSGAHMNPAVTIAFAVQRVFPVKEVLPYITSQVSGALAASFVLKLLFPTSLFLGATLPAGSAVQSFVLEAFLTFFLMTTVVNVAQGAKEKGLFAGIAIGSVVLLEAMFAGPISGASMNPARSLAPAIVSGHTEFLWVYITAPLIGALTAIFVHKLLK